MYGLAQQTWKMRVFSFGRMEAMSTIIFKTGKMESPLIQVASNIV
jgi:hypothetical protein